MNDYEFWNDLDKIFEAIVAYQEKSIEFNKRFINPWVNLGYNFDKKEIRGAIAAHKNAVEIDPKNATNWFELAKAYTESGNFNKAIEAYQQAIDLGLESGELYKNLGMVYAMNSNYQESVPVFQQALGLLDNETDKALIWNHLGNVYRKLNAYELAFRAFRQADQLEGLTSSNLEDQSAVAGSEETLNSSPKKEEQTQNGQAPDKAAPTIESPSTPEEDTISVDEPDLEIEGEDVLEAENNGISYRSYSFGDEESAEDDHKFDYRDNLPVVFEMDFSENTLEDFLEAESPKVDDAVETQPMADQFSTMEEARFTYFEEKMQPSKVPSAAQRENEPPSDEENEFTFSAYEEYLQDTIEPIRNGMTDDQLEEKRTISMISDELRTTRSDANKVENSPGLSTDAESKNAHVWNELGNIYLNAGSLDDAIAAYIRAIELDNQFAWPYTNLAMAYVQKEQLEEAILLYQRSIELFSEEKDKAITWNRLGNLYRRMEDYEKAIAAYQRADDLDPGNPALMNQTNFNLLGSEKIYQEIGSTL